MTPFPTAISLPQWPNPLNLMINFRDVARNIERNAVNTAISAVPLQLTLSQGINRVGSPQNLLTPNHNLDTPIIGPDGTPLVLLRASTIPIGEGILAA